VKAYFGYGGGFASLFDGGETFSLDGGTVFDGSALLSLMELVEFGFFVPALVNSFDFVVDNDVFQTSPSSRCRRFYFWRPDLGPRRD
jgi:hypothetical protein